MSNIELTVIKTVKNADVQFSVDSSKFVRSRETPESAILTLSGATNVRLKIVADGYSDSVYDVYVSKTMTVTPDINKMFTLTINPTPPDSKVYITYYGKTYETNTLSNIKNNTSVSYIVSKPGMERVSDTIVMTSDSTLNISLEPKTQGDYAIAHLEAGFTDSFSKIKLLTEADWSKLSPEKRENYVQYDPKLSSFTQVDYTKAVSDALTEIYFMLPIVDKISVLTNGTLDEANFYFLQLIKQLGPIATAAHTVGDKIRGIRKALDKLGIGELIDILVTAFQLIGAVAGMIYAQQNNTGTLIKPYAEVFKDIDINELLRKTVGQTIPGMQYVIDTMEGKPLPDVDWKEEMLKELDHVMEISGITQECMYALSELQQLILFAEDIEEAIQYIFFIISTMGTGWALGSIADLIKKLKVDNDAIRRALKNGKFGKNLKFMKNIADKSVDQEKKYINQEDLDYLNELNKNDSEDQIQYMKGYEDGVENGSKGETQDQMEAKIAKYITESEQAGKDFKMYTTGYRTGWRMGSLIYKDYLNNLTTDEQRDSYESGYNDGHAYGTNVRDYSRAILDTGIVWGFVDIDNHIHRYTQQQLNDEDILGKAEPIGRIGEDNKIYSFPNETVIGSYDEKNNRITINNVEYARQDNIIIDTSIIINDPDEGTINKYINFLHRYEKTMIERSNPDGTDKNPYYSRGWEQGYLEMETENTKVSSSINENKNGETTGYSYAANDKTINYLKTQLNNESSIYKRQGIVYGYNDYQSKYNSGYSQGWSGSVEKLTFGKIVINESNEDEFVINEEETHQILINMGYTEVEISALKTEGSLDINKICIKLRYDYMQKICSNYGLNYNEEKNKSSNQRDPVFRGALQGWNDVWNSISDPNWRNSYYDSI